MFAMVVKEPPRSEKLRLRIAKTAADIAVAAVLGPVVLLIAAMAATGAVLLLFAFAGYASS